MALSMGPPSTTKLPELVRDSRLETRLDGETTIHTYYDRPGRRAEPRREIWKKQRLIGNGGNGVVWLEKQLAGGPSKGSQARYRAVKQITLAQATSVLQVCKSELEALAKFSRRKYVPWFVESFGWYEGSGFLSMAMEYCPLGDLQQFLIERTRLSENDTREIVCQVVKGLQFMHEEGFAHRDLKPRNILIKSHPPEDEWWVKICDLGLSKRIEEVGAGTTSVKGTPGFFAPEQLGLGGADPRMADPFGTDIWCLGEMTFRMLCGKAAFPSYDYLCNYHQGTAMFPRECLDKVSASGPAMSFITSAMAVQPKRRLEIHQASNHEWFQIKINHDPTSGQSYPSDPVLGPLYSDQQCAPSLCTEPSGSWSTVLLPLRPIGAEATADISCGDEHRQSRIVPEEQDAHDKHKTERGERDPENEREREREHKGKEVETTLPADDRNSPHNSRRSSSSCSERRVLIKEEPSPASSKRFFDFSRGGSVLVPANMDSQHRTRHRGEKQIESHRHRHRRERDPSPKKKKRAKKHVSLAQMFLLTTLAGDKVPRRKL
ncbi:kinase-like domain-containing protein [Xylaria telfairii]|nr:kinase-like domain-containing protein [Xylaria telfairii]